MKHTGVVAGVGAVGGMLSWLFAIFLGIPSNLHVLVALPISVLLGAGAGVVFVFLIANTDRTDQARLYALALLSGFFWQPVWEGSRALVDREMEDRRVEQAQQSAQAARELTESLDAATDAERPEILAKIQRETERVAALSEKVDSVSGRTDIQLAAEPLVEKLKTLPPQENQPLIATLQNVDVKRRLSPSPSMGTVNSETFIAINDAIEGLKDELTGIQVNAAQPPS